MTPARLTDGALTDWVRLARTPQVGPVTFAQLLARFGSAGAAIDALPELSRKAGRRSALKPPGAGEVEDEIAATRAHGADLLPACDPAYPKLLAALAPPPPVISVLGDKALFQPPSVALVGARNASAAGRKLARDLAAGISAAGYVTVSGLARGIDGEAHAASLKGGTIAVLGGGVDHVYPPQHERLYAAIAGEGLIVSESPFGHRATAKDFPRRNRIITGLALGVVVVEASERSGSLISARTAGEQGREVMAVPGSPLDPRAAGANRLIKEGAHLVTTVDDVLDVLAGLARRAMAAPGPPDFLDEAGAGDIPEDQVEAVFQALSPHAMPIDEIARAAELGAARCAAILMELELAGRAETLSGGLARRAIAD